MGWFLLGVVVGVVLTLLFQALLVWGVWGKVMRAVERAIGLDSDRW